jgi:hypothetical protein
MKEPSRPFTIRLESDEQRSLAQRAKAHGRSPNQEIKAIVRDVLSDTTTLLLMAHVEELRREQQILKKFLGDMAIALLVEMGAAVEEAEEFVRRSLGR